MKKFALIENSTVVGVVEGSEGGLLINYYQQQGKTCVQIPDEQEVKVGDSHADGLFTPQLTVLADNYAIRQWRSKASLSRRQFKIGEALYQVNGSTLIGQIVALLDNLPEPTKTVATISYQESTVFNRLDPFVVQFSDALGMTEQEVDAFFEYCMNEQW